MADNPATLLAAALRHDPSGPLITFYDDAIGERTELSATTLANWVAKTANLLADDLDVQPGDAVCVRLPAHWQTATVLLGLWSVGALPTPDISGADLVVCDEPGLENALGAGAREVLGLSLAPMNAPLSMPPDGVVDYAAVVLGAGDHFGVVSPSGQAEATAARLRATQTTLTAGDRLLVAQAQGLADAVDWLLAPLCAPASVVLCRNADRQRLTRRAADERVTAVYGAAVEGLRRIDG